jgi:UDP-N-acetylglucosamine--N-acetylmuramyl-(pentapeptide) pyrophosphoryl-undecaprenol N-acetylglucosamine transferase
MKRIMLVGGGSGGHFYPLIAVAEKLNLHRQNGNQIELIYMGPEPYSEEALRENGINFVYCPSGKQRKYFSLLNYLDIFKIIYGFFVAIVKLYVIYPDVIFSKGSYTSVPVILAGWVLRIPIVIHESDSRPGSANKLAARFARYIAISFDEAASFFPAHKIAQTGVPLRSVFSKISGDPLQELGLPKDKPMLFITGGSLGAERLNLLILATLDELLPMFTVFHQTGASHEIFVQSNAASKISDATLLDHYFVKGTLTGEEMNLAEQGATFIISRAGAGSIFEIAQKGKPSILIPIPEDVSHDQKSNAYAYARAGACSVLEEKNFSDGLLTSEIIRIMTSQSIYDAMSEAAYAFGKGNAAQTIAETLIGITEEHT